MKARVISSAGLIKKYGEEVDVMKEVESFLLDHIADDELVTIKLTRDNNETSLTEETLVIQGKDYRRCKYFRN